MSQSTLLKISGIYTFPSHLGSVPPGALVKAKNIVINRDSIAESRRGFKIYGSSMDGTVADTAHQLFTYKNRILRHWGTGSGTTLDFDSDGAGTFTSFSGTIAEVTQGLRIKGLEANSNFYFTTSSGIKKISVSDASQLATASITNSGGIKALDVTTSLNSQTGFFNQESIIAYRVVWGYKDANTNEILGTPSARAIISNPLTPLLIKDFNALLSLLDSQNVATGIHSQNYLTTYKVNANSSSATLRTNLISLASAIDTDVPAFTVTNSAWASNVVTLTLSTNPTNILSINDPITVSGMTPTGYNGNYTITGVTASTITYTLSSNPGAFSAGGNVKRTKYASITQPTALSITPTTDQLVSTQTYYNNIVTTLQGEPSGIVTTGSVTFASSLATSTSTVNLTFTIPAGITTAYFFQVYRTAQTTVATGTSLSNNGFGTPYDPGDEQEQVYEANPTSTDLSNGFITIQDITPDSFRGANLYTNEFTGEGISQENDIPPLAKDIALFKNFTFYANTITKYRQSISLLSVSKLVSGTSTFIIKDGTTTNTYTFVGGVAQIATVVTTTLAAVAGAGKYFTISSAGNVTNYYVWFNVNSGNTDPTISNKTGIQVAVLSTDTNAQIATKLKNVLQKNIDFNVSVSSNTVTITNSSVGISTSPVDVNTGFTVAVTTTGVGEDSSNKKVLISTLSTPAQQVDETARSLVRVINKDASGLVYAFYTSTSTSVPGQITLEARTLGQAQFYLNCNSATTTGVEFDPALPLSGTTIASDNEVSPNRIYYSKLSQPEAVPIVNYFDVGPKDKSILRILALRDSLIVLKEDAVYRVSTVSPPFIVSLVDSSTFLKATDSAVVLNNLIFAFTSQGIVQITDTGVQVQSRPIEDQIIKLSTSQYTNFNSSTFGVSYESDRSYYLFTVTNTSDSYATQCFRFNSFTNSWTTLDLAKRCGIVNFADDKLYLGPTDINFVEQERKTFDRTDYADREISITLGSSSVSGTTLLLPSLTNISVGDVFVQTQYLTINQFNQLLSKLDRDTYLTSRNYSSTLLASAGMKLSDQLDLLITKIANEPSRVASLGSTAAGTYLALEPTSSDFSALQTNFNSLIALLNADSGVGYKNYLTSMGTTPYEFNILTKNSTNNSITSAYSYPIIEGPATVYNHINCELQWVPQTLSDVSLQKHVSEGTIIFEDSSFAAATISYSSDLSSNFDSISFNGNTNGVFGNFIYGTGIYGGNGSGIPFRTYIPLEKQRCRYINCNFKHTIAREIFSLYGMSLTYNPTSTRGWR